MTASSMRTLVMETKVAAQILRYIMHAFFAELIKVKALERVNQGGDNRSVTKY